MMDMNLGTAIVFIACCVLGICTVGTFFDIRDAYHDMTDLENNRDNN